MNIVGDMYVVVLFLGGINIFYCILKEEAASIDKIMKQYKNSRRITKHLIILEVMY